MALVLVTVPIYLSLVGYTRYGVLSIVWAFLGYFGLFDPGLSRAATYHIARMRDAPARNREDVFWTAMLVNLAFGTVGGLAFYVIARYLFISAFKIPQDMRSEVLVSLPWLAAAVPVSIISNALSSVLQAREWFGVSNAINVGTAVLIQLAPLAVAYIHGPDLAWLIPAMLLARVVGMVPAVAAIVWALPLCAGGGFRKPLLGMLFSYGGWITVSNLVAPILVTIDRVLIGSVLSVEAVAFYTVPYNLVTKVSVIPGALATSLFPKLSRGNAADSGRMADEAVLALAAVMTPLVVVGILTMPIFMRLWVGSAFALKGSPVGIILLLGLWINGLAYIPNSLLQANNRPDLTAKFHAAELLPFLGVLWLGVQFFGLIGAAWAWTLRVTLDAVLLFMAAHQHHGWSKLVPGVVIVLLAPLLAPESIVSLRTIAALVWVAVAVVWSWSISPRVRDGVMKELSRVRLRGVL